jgi:seryl-tRNA synthetase
MLDIKFVRDNPDVVKENIKKKFQDEKLPLVDQVIDLYNQALEAKQAAEALQANRNALSKQIGMLKGQIKKNPDQAEALEAQVAELSAKVVEESEEREALLNKQKELDDQVREILLVIPNIIDPSVPIGPNDEYNVEVERFGEPVTPDFPIPYHTEIMESFNGLDMDSAGRVAGNGFYYLLGDIARLHEAVLAYARDFMINKGFTYVIPPFMMHGDVVKGVMSFPEMEAMMYKIEGEDLYLIGTSEHTMIGRFKDQIIPGDQMPVTLTSYSPCFRKEKGAHGIEERGIYRIHQFEKQEMIVVCKPEDSMAWYDKLWRNSVELFRSLDIPVRQLECCSGDLADLKVKSCDIEAWSPRQQKYFEVCSCSNLGDAQSRRLGIRYTETVELTDKNGKKKVKTNNVLAHTLNNTCVAPPRMLIAFLENNLQADGSVRIPEALRPYMGGKEVLEKANTYVPPQQKKI